MRRWFYWLSLAAALLAIPAHADAPIEQFRLANGMEVVVLPNHRIPAVTHMMWYRVGAGEDPQGKSGLAHYLEHMMFQGTKKYSPGQLNTIVMQHGGQMNAFTGHDATSYFISIAKEHLPLVMEMEADRLRGLAPTDANAIKERSVIIEERRQVVENNPQAMLSEQMNAMLFRHHVYGTPVIGWKHEMEGLTKQDVLAFHNRYYTASNAILVIAGDITAKEAKPLVEKYYGRLPKAPVPTRHWLDEPPHLATRQIELRHANVKQPQWQRLYATASMGYGTRNQVLPLYLFSQILGGGKNSRLYQALVVEQKIASAVDTGYTGLSFGPGRFSISVVPEKGVDMATIEKAVDAVLANALNTPPTPEETTRSKTLLKSETLYARDSLSGIAHIMGWLRIIGMEPQFYNEWPRLVDAITTSDVELAIRDNLVKERSVTGLLLPETTP